jgi:hypothetical protein
VSSSYWRLKIPQAITLDIKPSNQIMMSNFRKHFGENISSEVEENMGHGITLFEPLTNHKIRIVLIPHPPSHYGAKASRG